VYKLNPIDPKLESAWSQASNLKCDILVSKFAFKWGNLCRYNSVTKKAKDKKLPLHFLGRADHASDQMHDYKVGGCTTVACTSRP
jgi:hypothetical protein